MLNFKIFSSKIVNSSFQLRIAFHFAVLCQIICAEPGESAHYKDAELHVGRYERVKDSPYFETVIDKHIKRFESAVKGLKNATDASLNAWKRLIENMICELEQMKGTDNG